MKRSIVGNFIALSVILGVMSWGNYTRAQETATGFVPITVDNVAQLELVYEFQGWCNVFSPDSSMITTRSGVYALSTGDLLFETNGFFNEFSSDGSLLYVERDHVYLTSTGEQILRVWGRLDEGVRAAFSPDNRIMMMAGFDTTIFDLQTGEQLVYIPEHTSILSPNGEFLAVLGKSVYNLTTGDTPINISEDVLLQSLAFSGDSRYFVIAGDGVYDTETWQRLVSIPQGTVSFSPDNHLLAVGGDNFYDTLNWQPITALQDVAVYLPIYPIFSPDNSMVASSGIYDLATGNLLFDLSGIIDFSPDSRLIITEIENGVQGIYTTASWELLNRILGYAHGFSPDGVFIAITERTSGRLCDVYGVPVENP